MRRAMASAMIALLAACSSGGNEEPESTIAGTSEKCMGLTAAALGAEEAAPHWVAADAEADLPAYCEITATLSPAEGSEIGVVYRMPAEWNGKLLGIGGGGWAGNVTLMAASEGLKKGYATLQTDGGHPGTDVWDNSWASNPEAATDFAYRAIHEMTEAGKQLASAFYGTEHRRAYFQGCSTGGRMALMEAQRFPADYDAISAGAPVYTLQVQTSAVLRNNTFARSGGFSEADLQLVQDSVLKACDADDGIEDGLIADPRACEWQPAELQCSGGKTSQCLSTRQVEALETIYEGVRAPDGEWAMLPMSRGGEAGWSRFVGTSGEGEDPTGGGGLVSLWRSILPNEQVDWANFSADRDVPKVRGSDFARMYEAKDPDLSAFFERGGKLLLWHGESDPGPSPVATNQYAEAVLAQNPEAEEQFRYFTLPGVEHCRGGPGADQIDLLEALDQWVRTGDAPDRLVGTNAQSGLTRPHCAWPAVARYTGEGDANDPANWQCVSRSST